MKRLLSFCLLVFFTCTAAATSPRNQPSRPKEERHLRGQIGLRIPEVGVAVDAIYDPRLDDLVPGYKILNVVLFNSSSNKLFMDPKKDRWTLQDADGNRRSASASIEGDGVWQQLSPELQSQLVYPRVVNPGEQANLPLFFKGKTALKDFRSLSFFSSYLKKELSFYSEGIPFQEKAVEQ